jgi:hypothetical protein
LFSLLLATPTSWAQPLLVDFNNLTTPTNASFQAYQAVNAAMASASNQTYSAFATTIGIDLDWDRPETAGTMRVVDRGTANTPEAADLLRDWIGTDNRVAASPNGVNPCTLTITGLPAGTFRWLSYHHDPNDQTGLFTAVVLDAFGARTNADIDISNGALPLASVTKWTANSTPTASAVRLRFAGQAAPVNMSFFLINGWLTSGFVSLLDEHRRWSTPPTGTPMAARLPTPPCLVPASSPNTVTVDITCPRHYSGRPEALTGPNSITLDAPQGSASGGHTIAVPISVTVAVAALAVLQ